VLFPLENRRKLAVRAATHSACGAAAWARYGATSPLFQTAGVTGGGGGGRRGTGSSSSGRRQGRCGARRRGGQTALLRRRGWPSRQAVGAPAAYGCSYQGVSRRDQKGRRRAICIAFDLVIDYRPGGRRRRRAPSRPGLMAWAPRHRHRRQRRRQTQWRRSGAPLPSSVALRPAVPSHLPTVSLLPARGRPLPPHNPPLPSAPTTTPSSRQTSGRYGCSICLFLLSLRGAPLFHAQYSKAARTHCLWRSVPSFMRVHP